MPPPLSIEYGRQSDINSSSRVSASEDYAVRTQRSRSSSQQRKQERSSLKSSFVPSGGTSGQQIQTPGVAGGALLGQLTGGEDEQGLRVGCRQVCRKHSHAVRWRGSHRRLGAGSRGAGGRAWWAIRSREEEHGGQLDPDTPVDQEGYEMIFKASERMMQDGESRDSETIARLAETSLIGISRCGRMGLGDGRRSDSHGGRWFRPRLWSETFDQTGPHPGVKGE